MVKEQSLKYTNRQLLNLQKRYQARKILNRFVLILLQSVCVRGSSCKQTAKANILEVKNSTKTAWVVESNLFGKVIQSPGPPFIRVMLFGVKAWNQNCFTFSRILKSQRNKIFLFTREAIYCVRILTPQTRTINWLINAMFIRLTIYYAVQVFKY